MNRFKKALCILLVLSILCSFGVISASAGYEGEKRAVIGANLSDEQIDKVYSIFGIKRGDVKELTVTNDEERKYLEGVVSESTIGTRSISCVFITLLNENDGLNIETTNINWCTKDIYKNALVTAGIYDADVIIAAPFDVSGTAALTGIYKAYEDITGQQLDETAKETAVEELVITSELADEIGSADAAEIVNELKKILDQTAGMTDDELAEEIRIIASNLDTTVTEDQIQQLISLVRQLEQLDTSELMDKVQSIQSAVEKMSDVGSSVSGFFGSVANFFKSIGDFFVGLFGGNK